VLTQLGIETRSNAARRRRNLQDHLQQRAIYKVMAFAPSTRPIIRMVRRGLMGPDYAFRPPWPADHGASQLEHLSRSDLRRERANIQFHVQPLSLDKFGDPCTASAITVSACNLQPTSRGTVPHPLAEPAEALRSRRTYLRPRRQRSRRRRHPHLPAG